MHNSNIKNNSLIVAIKSMTDTLRHRGPDDSGFWVEKKSGLAFGQRRLSINDLTKDGHQPMHSICGRYVFIYNGEIYNFRNIRNQLERNGHIFKGHSDTEVVLAAISQWGIYTAIPKFVGMFAFALWDKSGETLYLVRDRLGIKPLYWSYNNGGFLFASELKALRQSTELDFQVDRDSLAAFMRHNYIPAPHTIYKDVYKLPPASILAIRHGKEPKIIKYWIIEDAVAEGIMHRERSSEKLLIDNVEAVIEDAVSLRMIADVPLGAFLSGGIDSSAVVALMQKNSTKKIKTFSIGFHESNYNEAVYASEVARHLGTDHTEFYVSADDALAVIPKLPDIYDEPFADSSQIPTYLVSKLTRQYVTVALSGDGGDEVFAGYNRYFFAEKLIKRFNLIPRVGRRLIQSIIYRFPPSQWSRIFQFLPQIFNIPQAGDKLYKLAEILNCDRNVTYRKLISHWDNPEDLVLQSNEAGSIMTDNQFLSQIDAYIDQMQYLDTISYLPDDILTKVDRASMAASLEARVPLLDHRIIELAWKVPLSMKIRNGKGKWILRHILYKYVPEKLVDRPKMGFGVPIDSWLRGPLRDWAEDLLDRRKLNEQGYLNSDIIHQKWDEHLTGKRNWQYYLWDVLMFQAWHGRWMT